jgi:hypothetical protein
MSFLTEQQLPCIPSHTLTKQDLERQSQSTWPTYRNRSAEKAIQNWSQGQGSRSRGWGAMYPRKGHERQLLRQVCGDKCFLAPSTLGFPICAALPPEITSRDDPRFRPEMCFPVSQGVEAAYVRARQWKHQDIAEQAQALLQHLCQS